MALFGSTTCTDNDLHPQNGQRFFDITETRDLGSFRINARDDAAVFPTKAKLQDQVNPLLTNLSKSNMRENLETFTSFHTRYFKSDYGKQSSEWLLKQVQDIIKDAGADEHGVSAKHFPHTWQQSSVVCRHSLLRSTLRVSSSRAYHDP